MLSVFYLITGVNIESNSVAPDQTAPTGQEQSDLGLNCLLQRLQNISADNKADDF